MSILYLPAMSPTMLWFTCSVKPQLHVIFLFDSDQGKSIRSILLFFII